MAANKKKELIIGAVMLAAGIIYLILTARLPSHDGIDATFVPYLLATTLCVLGLLHLVTVFKAPQAVEGTSEEGEGAPETISVKTVIVTLALIAGYVALLQHVGFLIMTVVYLYLQFLVLTPVTQKANHIAYAAIAVATSVVIYFLFREAFDLLLPSGLLNF